MDKNSEITSRVEVPQDDVIVLGVASVETKGIFVAGEGMGGQTLPGIRDE